MICEFLESAKISKSVEGNIDVEVSFDEFNLDVMISYAGAPKCKGGGKGLTQRLRIYTQLSMSLAFPLNSLHFLRTG